MIEAIFGHNDIPSFTPLPKDILDELQRTDVERGKPSLMKPDFQLYVDYQSWLFFMGADKYLSPELCNKLEYHALAKRDGTDQTPWAESFLLAP